MAARHLTSATPLDAEDVLLWALDTYPANYLRCREMRHAWTVQDPFRLVDSRVELDAGRRGGHDVYARRVLACKCGMTRSDAYEVVKRRGRTALVRINSTYDAPDGYAIPGTGHTAGLGQFVLGAAFDAAINKTQPRRRRGA